MVIINQPAPAPLDMPFTVILPDDAEEEEEEEEEPAAAKGFAKGFG